MDPRSFLFGLVNDGVDKDSEGNPLIPPSPLEPLTKDHVTEEDEDECTYYIRNCKKYGMQVDPSVVITLRTKWTVMQPTKNFCEGSLLPLAGILDSSDYIKRMSLSGAGTTNVKAGPGNGNSNARILHQVLSRNKSIQVVDISYTGLDDDGVKELCEGLKKNNTVTYLNMARNHFTAQGVNYIRDMLSKNRSLKFLDLSRNALGFQSIQKLQSCGCAKHLHMNVEGNYVFEEIMNSLTHGLGFIASVIGTTLLMTQASKPEAGPYHFWSCAIFSFCLMMLYLSSTLYHSFFMVPGAKDILQIFDHVSIYLLIAGSYTPFMMIAMHHSVEANVLLVMEWTTALTGIVISLATCSVGVINQTTNLLEVMIYLAMGVAILCVWNQLVVSICTAALQLLIGGGVAYIAGIIFFILGEVKPIYHTVWHVFCLVGSLCHWLCIYKYVVVLNITMPST